MEGKRAGVGHPESFGRRYRLGGNKHYRYVYRRGKSTPSRNLVLVYLKGRDLKIGFSVSGKVGNAVTRNRIRRWLREDVRRMRTQLKCGKYIFVARANIVNAPHPAVTREMRKLLDRAGLIRAAAAPNAAAETTRLISETGSDRKGQADHGGGSPT